MRYRVSHVTKYDYAAPVAQCLSEAHLLPRAFPGQAVLDSRVVVEPAPISIEHRLDYFGNCVSLIAILEKHEKLTVRAESRVQVDAPPDCALPDLSWERARQMLRTHESRDDLAAYEFTFNSPFIATSPELAAYGAATFKPGAPLAEAAIELSRRIHTEFKYAPKATSIDVPLSDVLRGRKGVCQDFAHVMIGVLRSYGLAARYVSGYLRSGAQYTGAEASHAWVSVYVPTYGWLDLDPTNNVRPKVGHVTVAWGRDYGDVTPVKGVSLGGGEQKVDVEVRVVPEP